MSGILAQARRDAERAKEIGRRLDAYASYAAQGGAVSTLKRPAGTAPDEAAEFHRLAGLPPIVYEREREASAERLGVRVSALDKEVAKLRPKEEAGGSGHEVVFDEPEPWPSPVDGDELLDELTATLAHYVFMPDESRTACALWIIHSWTHEAARVSPILAVTSPEKRCGKTTLLEVLAALSRRPMPAANITVAPLFRAVEKYAPTLLIDEADTFLRGSDELRGVLNSGHRRRSASVIRCVGDDNEPRQFRTWAPKAIALIGKLSPTLADRSIEVALCRRGPGEPVTRWRDESFPDLRRKLSRFAADNMTALSEARPGLPDGLHDRALDNWEPLFAIADAAGGHWTESARKAAKGLSGDEDESIGATLLADIRGLFETLGADRIASANLCEHLAAMESRPWPEWGRAQKAITPRQVARILKPFGIVPGSRRIGAANAKGYEFEQFAEAFLRYLPGNSSVTTSQPAQGAAFSDIPIRHTQKVVTDGESLKPAPQVTCDVVTDRNPQAPDEANWPPDFGDETEGEL